MSFTLTILQDLIPREMMDTVTHFISLLKDWMDPYHLVSLRIIAWSIFPVEVPDVFRLARSSRFFLIVNVVVPDRAGDLGMTMDGLDDLIKTIHRIPAHRLSSSLDSRMSNRTMLDYIFDDRRNDLSLCKLYRHN